MTTGIQLNVTMLNVDAVSQLLRDMAGPKARGAYAKALNDAGFHVRETMQDQMRTRFDRVTPYMEKSVYVRRAKADKLEVTIEPAYMGGKGVDPQKILQAQSFGGRRRDKRSESALRRAGILPAGYQTAIPRDPYPGSDDGRGNIKGSFLVQILSYFQAFAEQGYKANMTDKGFKRLHKNGRKKDAAMGTKGWTKDVRGRRYIVTYGHLRGGARMTKSGEYDQRASNLKPGIWAISGTGGVDVKPVLLFVRAGTYQPRLSMDDVNKAADTQNYLDRRVRFRIREAAGI